MSTKTRAELEGYFETDDTPSSPEFTDFIDSVPNIEDDGVLLGGDPAITAHAGGGQANAYQLTKFSNGVTTCASVGDSIKCPSIVAGRFFNVVNATANSCNLYPQSGDQINSLGVDNPLAIAAGEMWVIATGGGVWVAGKLA